MPFVIIAAVIAIICVARYYHNKKERNKEITWQEVQKQTDTKRNTISIDTSENFSEGEDVPAREVHSRAEHKRKIANTPNRYVVIDLETTGLNPQYDFITEFGAVLVEDSEIVDTFEQLVKPKKRIPEEVEDLTGITNEMVSDAPSINIVLPKFLKFIGNDILVGHNIDFDSQFVSAACQRFNLLYKNKVCDTLELSQRFLQRTAWRKGYGVFPVPCNCHYLHRLCEHHRSAGLYTAYKRLECYRRTCDHEHCACGGCRNKSKRNKGLAEKLCQTCGDNRSAECNGACYQTAVALYATFRKRACVLYHHGAYRRRLPDSDTAGILGIL